MSEREAARLGGPTKRPPKVLEPWTNPRTGQTMAVDRGLDPSWAGNPGKDRPRLLAEKLARGAGALAGASDALAREAIRQVADSPLLERQLTAPKGDLPAALLDGDIARHLRTGDGRPAETRLVLLEARAAEHIRDAHPAVTAARAGAVLSAIPHGASFVVSEPGHYKYSGTDLVFCLRDAEGQWWKAIVRAREPRKVGIASLYDATEDNVRGLAKRPGAKVVRGTAPE